MHQFSRAIYRALSPAVIQTGDEEADIRERKRILAACEATVRRMTREPDFNDPVRSLFKSVRTSFRFTDQLHVRETIERHVEMCRMHIAADPGALEPDRRCRAYTRSGNPCEREPLPSSHYCPSHKDWAVKADDEAGVLASITT